MTVEHSDPTFDERSDEDVLAELAEEADLDDAGGEEEAPPAADDEPTADAPAIGEAVLAVALAEWNLGFAVVRANEDDQGRIRTYFAEGLGWSGRRWDAFARKPSWCTAFAAYCLRTAHARLGLEPPPQVHPRAGKNADVFAQAGRFLPASAVFGRDRLPLADAERMPGPGDLVIWQGHVGLLREIDADGNLLTIEGNTYIVQRGSQRWGVHPRRYSPRRDPKRWDTLKGFGLIG